MYLPKILQERSNGETLGIGGVILDFFYTYNPSVSHTKRVMRLGSGRSQDLDTPTSTGYCTALEPK